MNFSEDIAELESQLARVRGMVERDEFAVSESDTPKVERVFLATSKKMGADLEKRLQIAKAARAHEVIRLKFHAMQYRTGTIPLRSLAKFLIPLNAVLEKSAWRFWDCTGDASRIDQKFLQHLGLCLAGLNIGSTELVILGSTAPDLTGLSALESALRDIFDLLHADVEGFADRVHAIGIGAGKSLAEFLTSLEADHVAIELEWSAADKTYRWNGRTTEVTRVRALLDEIGEPITTTEQICWSGKPSVHSKPNRDRT